MRENEKIEKWLESYMKSNRRPKYIKILKELFSISGIILGMIVTIWFFNVNNFYINWFGDIDKVDILISTVIICTVLYNGICALVVIFYLED